DKEAKNYCKKCSNCSRNIVFITEIGQDTFNIQISLQHEENEKVSSEKNRDEAADTQMNSGLCRSCNVHFLVSNNVEKTDKQRRLKITLFFNGGTRLAPSDQ
ncbi:hypothetical protein XENORESO_011761, partial [Xenotaenia resolanae]